MECMSSSMSGISFTGKAPDLNPELPPYFVCSGCRERRGRCQGSEGGPRRARLIHAGHPPQQVCVCVCVCRHVRVCGTCVCACVHVCWHDHASLTSSAMLYRILNELVEGGMEGAVAIIALPLHPPHTPTPSFPSTLTPSLPLPHILTHRSACTFMDAQ